MSGSTENMASGTPEQRGEVVFNLSTVQRMLPLVQRIIGDFLQSQKVVDRLAPEQDRLDRQRRELAWPERQRRYQVREELSVAERELQEAMIELQVLNVALLDPETGRVGFPTLVNNRRAFFSWKPADEGLHFWHFAEESIIRPIPSAWLKEISLISKH
jgi:hypothetical protein